MQERIKMSASDLRKSECVFLGAEFDMNFTDTVQFVLQL